MPEETLLCGLTCTLEAMICDGVSNVTLIECVVGEDVKMSYLVNMLKDRWSGTGVMTSFLTIEIHYHVISLYHGLHG